jgi:hypothetical protein
MPTRALILCSLFVLAGCAAAMPGYTPPDFNQKKVVQPMRSGDMDAGGTYHMSNQEKAADCRHIRGYMMVTISRLRHRDGEVPTSGLAIGANRAATTFLGGSSKGLDREAEYQRDRARLEAYNRHLAQKGCETIDIQAELSRQG